MLASGAYGRLSSMRLTPTTGLSILVQGQYQTTLVFDVDMIVALPDTARAYYVVGDAAGNVTVTAVKPAPVYPVPSNTIPVLLATVLCNPTPEFHDQFGPGDGIKVTFTGTARYVPLVPGTVHVHANAVVSTDDGAGHLGGAGVVSGTVNYATGDISITFLSPPSSGVECSPWYNWIQTQVHPTWITAYPPVDNLIAWTRKLGYDLGFFEIGGKDVPVGVVSTTPQAALSNPLAAPYGLDSVSGRLYRCQSSGHEYQGDYLQGMYYFAAASEGAVVTAANSGGLVALTIVSGGSYLDASTITGSLSDGTPLGPFTLNEFGQLTFVGLPSSPPAWTGQTVNPIVGGGLRNISFGRGISDAYDQLSCFEVNESGPSDLAALFQELTISDRTLTWSFPDGLGAVSQGTYGIFNPGPGDYRRCSITNVSTGVYPFHLTYIDQCDVSNVGISDGSHGNGILCDSGVELIRAIGGKLGWSRCLRTRISAPPPQSPRYRQTVTTGGISFQADGSAAVSTTDDLFDGCLLDGWAFWVPINTSKGVAHTIVRNCPTLPSEFWGSRSGYNTWGFNFHSGAVVSDFYIYNIWNADTGEVYFDLNGKWDIVGGNLVRSPLPAADFYGEPIEVWAA